MHDSFPRKQLPVPSHLTRNALFGIYIYIYGVETFFIFSSEQGLITSFFVWARVKTSYAILLDNFFYEN